VGVESRRKCVGIKVRRGGRGEGRGGGVRRVRGGRGGVGGLGLGRALPWVCMRDAAGNLLYDTGARVGGMWVWWEEVVGQCMSRGWV